MPHETVRERDERLIGPIWRSGELLARRERWYALRIDGTPFGEHFADEPRYDEMYQLAMVLVSCNLDQEIRNAQLLPERVGTNTADFEVELVDGNVVRIEVTQFTDDRTMDYTNKLEAVFNIVQPARQADGDLSEHLRGLHIIFEFSIGVPDYEQKSVAASEMLDVLRRIQPGDLHLSRWITVGGSSPMLHTLGARYYAAASSQSDTRVQYRLPLTISDSERILESAARVMRKKSGKYDGYSDQGEVDVWLAAFARDEASGLGRTAIEEMTRNIDELSALPFERLLIATAVSGLRIDRDGSPAVIYQSISQQGEG